jgi:activating signal cointegrator 1
VNCPAGDHDVLALTLDQPFASLIAASVKKTETRSWGTSYRGWLMIHASARWTRAIRDDALTAADMLRRQRSPDQVPGRWAWHQTLGSVLCVARLADCVRGGGPVDEFDRTFGGFGPDRWAWRLEDLRPLSRPVPARGYQKLWVPSPALLDEVRAVLPRRAPGQTEAILA